MVAPEVEAMEETLAQFRHGTVHRSPRLSRSYPQPEKRFVALHLGVVYDFSAELRHSAHRRY